ncbi:ATP-binding protein [Mesoplasma corruscae]|uniref:ATPase AAA n=1 Tax=Mesoplasma corruscae TaxID=216874 RepID=A0A2S5RH76_9MOLU|nr:ATP-binding protein [Mesoplasma corruscae]PPE06651.1 ATPase AAA [Mesoplasma corruscae]
MRKRNILNLIKYHCESKDYEFKNEAHEIAKFFDSNGDSEISEYIMGLLFEVDTFTPQELDYSSDLLKATNFINDKNQPLPLPESIAYDIKGIINAINNNVGVNKFLFQGLPGTGKTETAKQIARILNKKLYVIEINNLIDSKLGQTNKNISSVFKQINSLKSENVIILLDEMDAIALDRINSNDIREMGRVTSTFLKELDAMNETIPFIATTNLFDNFDKALIRRFDSVIDFNKYSTDDLILIAEIILNDFLKKFKNKGRNMVLFKKIIKNMHSIPLPGDLKNLIKVSLAFSDKDDEFEYLRTLLKNTDNKYMNINNLKEKGYTVREIEILTGISKSQVSRELKGMQSYEGTK